MDRKIKIIKAIPLSEKPPREQRPVTERKPKENKPEGEVKPKSDRKKSGDVENRT